MKKVFTLKKLSSRKPLSFHRFKRVKILNPSASHIFAIYLVDESYNPFSDEFRFHSLYENLPETNYQSLGKELASFIPNENRNYFTIPILSDKLIASLLNKLPAQDKFANLVSEANIFNKLGLYENFTDTRSGYTFQLNKNPNYCNQVDVLNLIYPSNLYHHYGVVDTYFRSIH